jgi:coenzyme F420-reducing hydrogenase beta subunit
VRERAAGRTHEGRPLESLGNSGTDMAASSTSNRSSKNNLDEAHFGVFEEMVYARMRPPVPGAQWTGVVTAAAAAMLREGHVDAVVVVDSAAGGKAGVKAGSTGSSGTTGSAGSVGGSTSNAAEGGGGDDGGGGDPLAPMPLLARTVAEVYRGRGVKPSLCPSLAVLDEVRDDPKIRRLLFCGVGCSVHALRSLKPSPEVRCE